MHDAIALAHKNIEEKNPNLSNKKATAQAIGVGAILFSDLKQHRKHDIEFNLAAMLKTEGETGPYVQYAYARAHSVLRKTGANDSSFVDEVNDFEWEIVKLLEQFPHITRQASDHLDPSIVAKYAINLAQAFNSFYSNVHVLSDVARKAYRISLVASVAIVLKEALRLLGMEAPEEM